MNSTSIRNYLLKLLGFSAVLFGIHYYLIYNFFEGQLYFPLWTIYVFNAVLVAIVYVFILIKSEKDNGNVFQLFLGLTAAKMLLAILFLLPIFLGKSDHKQLEVINFFMPYFLFLAFEIFSLNKFLQKS